MLSYSFPVGFFVKKTPTGNCRKPFLNVRIQDILNSNDRIVTFSLTFEYFYYIFLAQVNLMVLKHFLHVCSSSCKVLSIAVLFGRFSAYYHIPFRL